ncbi:MAG: zinc ribbon domain-containing protein [Acidobacteriota bacterium]
MYCPSCATPAVDGAKFCKVCGMNLTVISHALNGNMLIADPSKDRENKRYRKQISEGIQGIAIGAALLFSAVVAYVVMKDFAMFAYPTTLILALIGLVKLFRNIGEIVDAKVGGKIVENKPPNRGTAGLSATTSPPLNPASKNSGEYRSPFPQPTRAVSTGAIAPVKSQTGSAGEKAPLPTGRVNREYSTPLKKADIDEDLMARLRN